MDENRVKKLQIKIGILKSQFVNAQYKLQSLQVPIKDTQRCSTTNITNQDYLISDQYVANSGKAALFEKVSNYKDFFTDL